MKTLGIIGAGDLGKQIAYYAINDHHYDNDNDLLLGLILGAVLAEAVDND